MSFSLELKQELLENKGLRVKYKKTFAYGLFLFGRAFDREEVALHTENEDTARLFTWFIQDFLGRDTVFSMEEQPRGTKSVYAVSLPLLDDRLRLLALFGQEEGINRAELATPELIPAFLSGAYLACGNIIDPEKSYHMEFVVRGERLCRELTALLDQVVPGARDSIRRQNYVVYYKECASIQDLMTLMGATKSCLRVIDIEMYKNVRNQANRTTNCETANIDKQVDAAALQVEDILLILEERGEDILPSPLQTVARLRLAHPDASLRELSQLSPETLSRSGIHHRLEKLQKLAREIRETKGR